MDVFMIFAAKYLYLAIILLSLVYGMTQPNKRKKQMLLVAIISLPLTYIIAKICGHFYYDPRPFVAMHIKPLIQHAANNGFPSDHMLISSAFAAIIFLFNKKLGIAAFLLALLVGISRVYVRVHSPIDIIGSFVISIVVLSLVVVGLKKFFRFGI